jgi:hypothetical protein
MRGGRFPFGEARFDFFIAQFDTQALLGQIENDLIAFRHEGDGSAAGGFGGGVSGHEAARRAAEAAVGEESDVFAEAESNQGSSEAEHFAHAGPAAGAFIAHDDDVALFDLSANGGVHGVFFAIENARRAAVVGAFVSGSFYHASIRNEIASQNHEAARAFDWVGKSVDYILSWFFLYGERFLIQGF